MLEGKVVVVTGSSRGIGRETARMFAAAGARVVLNARNRETLDATVQSLRQDFPDVFGVAADISTPDGATELINTTIAQLGRLDILVNNAGSSMRGRFADTSPEVLRAVVDGNVLGAALPTRMAIEHIVRSNGSIVFVSSLSGVRGFPGVAIYSAAKMALTGLAEALQAELAGTQVHVGVVFPAFVQNDPDKVIYAADGSMMKSDRPASLTQIDVASAIMRCATRRRRFVYMTALGKLLHFVNRIFPGIARAIVSASSGRIHGVPER